MLESILISQYSQENNCAGVSFDQVTGLKVCIVIKKGPMNYPVNIAKFLKTASFYTTPLVTASKRLSELHSVYRKKPHHRCFTGL